MLNDAKFVAGLHHSDSFLSAVYKGCITRHAMLVLPGSSLHCCSSAALNQTAWSVLLEEQLSYRVFGCSSLQSLILSPHQVFFAYCLAE